MEVKMGVKGGVKHFVLDDTKTIVQCSMVKNAIKREQSQACLGYAEREHFRRSQCSMFNVQKCD